MVGILRTQNEELRQLIKEGFSNNQESIYNSRDVSVDTYNLLQSQSQLKSEERE